MVVRSVSNDSHILCSSVISVHHLLRESSVAYRYLKPLRIAASLATEHNDPWLKLLPTPVIVSNISIEHLGYGTDS